MKSVNLVSLGYDETLYELELALLDLESITLLTDFTDESQSEAFVNYILYVKTFYERLDTILRG